MNLATMLNNSKVYPAYYKGAVSLKKEGEILSLNQLGISAAEVRVVDLSEKEIAFAYVAIANDGSEIVWSAKNATWLEPEPY